MNKEDKWVFGKMRDTGWIGGNSGYTEEYHPEWVAYAWRMAYRQLTSLNEYFSSVAGQTLLREAQQEAIPEKKETVQN